MADEFNIQTTVTFYRQPELIDQAIIAVFGYTEFVHDAFFCRDKEAPNTITFHSSEFCRKFCTKMNELRGIKPAQRNRFPILFGSVLN